MRILTDEHVRALPVADAVAAAREALEQFARGALSAPPRARSELGAIDYVYTAGALEDGTSGFRAYRAGQPRGDQLVALWAADGRLTGLVVGDELGPRRTGALGAVAVDVLARADATRAAIIGTGTQAFTQLWAIAAVRPLEDVRVFSRDPARREAFAARAREELGLPVRAVASAAEAAADADIVVLATKSTTPVIDLADIAPGTHVSTLGPNARTGHETPDGLAERADVLVSDSPQQAAGFGWEYFTDPSALRSLGNVLIGTERGRTRPEDITLFGSVGLAGSELVLAQRLFART